MRRPHSENFASQLAMMKKPGASNARPGFFRNNKV